MAVLGFISIDCIAGIAYYANNPSLIKSKIEQVCLLSCYTAGNFFGQICLAFKKIKNLGWLTLQQFMVFLMYCSNIGYKWIGVYIQFVLIFVIGVIGGFGVINGLYIIQHDKVINSNEREIGINVVGLYSDLGIIVSHITCAMVSYSIILTTSYK